MNKTVLESKHNIKTETTNNIWIRVAYDVLNTL